MKCPVKDPTHTPKTVPTKGYSTTMMLSTFRKVDARQILRREASGALTIPASRVAERVFGEGGPLRSKLFSGGNLYTKLSPEYEPRLHSCLNAFAELW